jgi:hypothetical protein
MLKKVPSADEPGAGRLAVLKALAQLDQPSIHDLIEITGYSRSTVQRQLKELRELFEMEISFCRTGWKRGAVGYYQVESWGLFNPDMLKAPE